MHRTKKNCTENERIGKFMMNFKKVAAMIAAIAVAATATVSTVYAAGNKNAAPAITSITIICIFKHS